MPLPIRHLPVVQNWDCHGCGTCCHEYHVFVTDEERRRIAGQGWEKDAEIGDLPLFAHDGPPWRRRYRLNQRAGGACIFLSDKGRCRIHEQFGSAAKPLACQLYPFILVPAGDHWRVGLRFSCPSATASKGRPLPEHQKELDRYALGLEAEVEGDLTQIAPPVLQPGQRVRWKDLSRFSNAIVGILENREDRLERRVRKLLALAKLCRLARFEKVQGKRLTEFLQLVTVAIDREVPADPGRLPPPSWVGRVFFRQALAMYARKDRGPDRNQARSKAALLGAAWRFAQGTGAVPRVHARLPETTFEQVEQARRLLSPDAEELLERYYVSKVASLQFCGRTFFHYSFWEGLQALCQTLPLILWLTRAFKDLPPIDAVRCAIEMVDYNYGYNPVLGTRRQRLALRILCRRGELERLIAWYAR